MRPFEIRWKNFRSFEDTGWVDIRPLTVIIGPNGSGKTSLLAPILLLKQTLESTDQSMALETRGPLFDAGSFRDALRNRDASGQIELGFRFHHHSPPPKPKPVGDYPPGEVDLAFALPDEEKAFPVLQEFRVLDVVERPMLVRKRTQGNRYSLRNLPAGPTGQLKKAIEKSPPSQFLFTLDKPIAAAFEPTPSRAHSTAEAERGDFSVQVGPLNITKPAALYLMITSEVAGWIEGMLGAVSFIGPLRDHPRRVYALSGEHPPNVGIRGEYAPEIIFRKRDPDLRQIVDTWLGKFSFGMRVGDNAYGEDAFSISVQLAPDGATLNLADTGFGLSQVLPLIVQSFYSDKRSILIAEQPEIHLNPRLQTVLADLFCEVASSGRGVIIETHSEHLLLRLRRLVAQGRMKAEDVSLLYVESSEGKSSVRPIALKSNGHIDNDEWPRGFFEDSLRESLELVAAQSRRSKGAD